MQDYGGETNPTEGMCVYYVHYHAELLAIELVLQINDVYYVKCILNVSMLISKFNHSHYYSSNCSERII